MKQIVLILLFSVTLSAQEKPDDEIEFSASTLFFEQGQSILTLYDDGRLEAHGDIHACMELVVNKQQYGNLVKFDIHLAVGEAVSENPLCFKVPQKAIDALADIWKQISAKDKP